MKIEEWRMIPGYEELYSLVGFDKIYSHTNDIYIDLGYDSKGYTHFKLSKDGIEDSFSLHRIVAMIYVPIPERYKGIPMSKLHVHHKDGNPRNCKPSNLEYLTGAEHNALHKSKKVYRYSLDGLFIDEWSSLAEIQSALGYEIGGISRCCLGIDKTAYGFQWSYEKHDSIPSVKSRYERIGEKHSKRVAQYDLDGNLIKIWPSMAEIQRQLGYFSTAISACCRGVAKIAYGFIWKYA